MAKQGQPDKSKQQRQAQEGAQQQQLQQQQAMQQQVQISQMPMVSLCEDLRSPVGAVLWGLRWLCQDKPSFRKWPRGLCCCSGSLADSWCHFRLALALQGKTHLTACYCLQGFPGSSVMMNQYGGSGLPPQQ